MDSESTHFQPSLSASFPVGWFVKESLTLLAPDGQANVIASSEPLDPEITTENYARVQGDLLDSEFPYYVEWTFEPATVYGELDGYVRVFEWTPEDGVPVVQIQLYAVRDGRGFTATATTPKSEFERYQAELIDVLFALREGRALLHDAGGTDPAVADALVDPGHSIAAGGHEDGGHP